MDSQTLQISLGRVLDLAAQQHGLVTRAQLLEMGLSAAAIKYRVRRGRLHTAYRGVYAVGRPQLTRLGALTAAVLASGPGAALSHEQAGEVHGLRRRRRGPIEVTVPAGVMRARPGIRLHRRALPEADLTTLYGIRVTGPVRTMLDLAARLPERELEALVNEADRLDLVDPERLRAVLAGRGAKRGAPALRGLIGREAFALTESELERRFLPIARRAGLPPPLTQAHLNDFRVDFFWPDLGLVVETDGLRYHRTPAQQARDRRRDQAHAAAGLTPLRFTHHQVAHEARGVETTLRAVLRRPPRAPP